MDADAVITFPALLVTGETYRHRRALRALGGVWRALESGYAVPMDRRDDLATLAGIDVEAVEYAADPFRPLSPDELRAYRQERKDRYADRLRDRADRADRRAQEARARVKPHEREFLALFEPVKRGHHSQRRHEKLIERAQRSFEDAGREASNAARLRSRADSLERARVKGDAAREAQAALEAARKIIALGDRVRHVVYGAGVVVKVNAVSVRVQMDAGHNSGRAFNLNPADLDLLAKGNGIAPEKPARAFRAGDLVWWHRHGIGNRAHCKPIAVTIVRATPRGYSVEWTIANRFAPNGVSTYRETAAEIDLEPREARP